MAKTNSGLVTYAKAQVGLPYWYGTYGQTASASLYKDKKKQYPSYYTASDFAKQYGKRVHDCVGLIKGYLWSSSTTATPSYNKTQDKSASGMYAASSEKGKINTFPKHAGQLVYKGTTEAKIHHVGVYDGNGYVYEAKGHAYGVVMTKFVTSEWDFWSQCPYCTDDTTTSTSDAKEVTASTIKAADSAQSFDKTLAGTYTISNCTWANARTGAGTSKKSLVQIPAGTKVKNYGYFTKVGTTNWLYVAFTYKNVNYEAFVSNTLLKKS
ncbi:MAG: NlpC/P60 family protein [Lachnospiraceae bacterium]|nr:NlpC/P60 family protein [Lachnospiraceae bacterium]